MTEQRLSRKKPYHHGDLRNALLQLGSELLATEGLSGFGLREIARRAGVSNAAIYRHFPDRDALLAELAMEGFRTLISWHQTSGEQQEPDPIRALEIAVLVYLKFAAKHPNLLRVMFGDLLSRHQAFPEVARLSIEAFVQLEQLIHKGQQAGVFGEGHVGEKALMCWGMMHGIAQIRMEQIVLPGIPESPLETLAHMMAQQLAQGL
ncbi:TetR/AcrR family transcriptional regulator [Deinococcus roseus]|uniref:TetR family transcriptional regulator n=1 Tax=Deinococcus roseus TaxID=392414 RepID=A0ABQ2CXS7_9DEIO|nr:TetR/AcrR family transcriptional regulator [Deinococcus roseus]GGJ27196.1 TetR family transcriptional regulator [Deinococcus roseus]